jgi:hypothetical protein
MNRGDGKAPEALGAVEASSGAGATGAGGRCFDVPYRVFNKRASEDG